MMVRVPARAGSFYPADPRTCRREVAQLFEWAAAALDGRPAGQSATSAPTAPVQLPDRIVGGIVPHAGYFFSGELAARTLEAVARRRQIGGPAVFVIFGAVHFRMSADAAMFERGVWQTPLGDAAVDDRLAQRILEQTNLIAADPMAHEREHSIEVQLPLIRFRFPESKIIPILVPPTGRAAQVGQAVGRTLDAFGVDAVVIGSTDLTHYGPSYGFTPQGVGPAGFRWAKQVNDAGVVGAVERLAADEVVNLAERNQCACGAGAVAAALAAASKLGATRGVVLEHATSSEILAARTGQSSDDSVGYLSAVLGA